MRRAVEPLESGRAGAVELQATGDGTIGKNYETKHDKHLMELEIAAHVARAASLRKCNDFACKCVCCTAA